MACPRFEPVRAVPDPQHPNARLPLIEEHEGICHAGPEPAEIPSELRFRCCNHGYSGNGCVTLPVEEKHSAFRYSVAAHTDEVLDVICVEERNHTPVRWLRVRYVLATGLLDTPLDNLCMSAQVIAFCQSYLRRFVS